MKEKKEDRYEELREARDVLGIGEEATMDEIKEQFHRLIHRAHPDKSGTTGDTAGGDEARRIIEAYEKIRGYCREYRISFSRESVKRYQSDNELWWDRFGNDFMWGPMQPGQRED